MQIMLYVLLGVVTLVLLVILYNRLYYEIHLARATKILNKELKKATRQQVDEFSKELRDTLYITINAMTESYEELAKSLAETRQMREQINKE